MAWTAPRTWSDGEVNTAAQFNANLRDDPLVLKVTRDDVGRISALSSATLADLSSSNVTGLARPGTDNDFSGGRTSFNKGTARVRLPVGADKYEDLGGGLRRGVWIEGDYFHHIASNQTTEWRYLGTLVQAGSPGLTGSVWVEDDDLHYVDADGDERRVRSLGIVGHTDSVAKPGSVWVETYLHWIGQFAANLGVRERPGHGDYHGDGTEHTDVHHDTPHEDFHQDSGHADSHGDSHVDAPHEDHTDAPAAHEDASHLDTHQDSHSDEAAQNEHGDIHIDIHQDKTIHSDVAHLDQPTVVT